MSVVFVLSNCAHATCARGKNPPEILRIHYMHPATFDPASMSDIEKHVDFVFEFDRPTMQLRLLRDVLTCAPPGRFANHKVWAKLELADHSSIYLDQEGGVLLPSEQHRRMEEFDWMKVQALVVGLDPGYPAGQTEPDQKREPIYERGKPVHLANPRSNDAFLEMVERCEVLPWVMRQRLASFGTDSAEDLPPALEVERQIRTEMKTVCEAHRRVSHARTRPGCTRSLSRRSPVYRAADRQNMLEEK